MDLRSFVTVSNNEGAHIFSAKQQGPTWRFGSGKRLFFDSIIFFTENFLRTHRKRLPCSSINQLYFYQIFTDQTDVFRTVTRIHSRSSLPHLHLGALYSYTLSFSVLTILKILGCRHVLLILLTFILFHLHGVHFQPLRRIVDVLYGVHLICFSVDLFAVFDCSRPP